MQEHFWKKTLLTLSSSRKKNKGMNTIEVWKQIREPDLQDLTQFVEEETTLMNDPLFSREALHEYTKGPEKQNQRRLKQMKNCFTKADKKKDVCGRNHH